MYVFYATPTHLLYAIHHSLQLINNFRINYTKICNIITVKMAKNNEKCTCTTKTNANST